MYTPIIEFNESQLNTAEAFIHRASQFLAMMGKTYLEDQADDSNANLAFDSKDSSIVGRKIKGNSEFSLDLNIPNWELQINEEANATQNFQLGGRTKTEAFDWLRNTIQTLGLDSSQLKYIDHYEVPEHDVDHGLPFQELNIDIVNCWLDMRSNANLLLNDLNDIVGLDSEIRIWPHHFDTGTYYELGKQKAIGAGWAIADSLCDNPYLYIYGWDGNASIDYSNLPELAIGKWIVTEGWQGAVVESVTLANKEGQYELLKSFMSDVVSFLRNQLN